MADDVSSDAKEQPMSKESKKSMAWSAVLIMLGVLAFYSGIRFLLILVPVAILVYYGPALPIFQTGRSIKRPSDEGAHL